MSMNRIIKLSEEAYLLGVKSDRFPKEAHWFKKQIRLNLIIGLVPLLIFFGGIAGSFYVIKSNMFITKGFSKSYEQLVMMKFSEAKRKLVLARSLSETFDSDLKLALQILGLTSLIAILFGSNALYKNPLLKGTEELREVLESNGFLKKDQKVLMLYVPDLGVFLELSPGNSAREMMTRDAVWASLGNGIKIGEYKEHPKTRKYVFFKIFYTLKKGTEYGYDEF